MRKTFPSTFNEGDFGVCGEVTKVDVAEYSGYQSQYTYMFNYLSDSGWVREGGRWVSPTPPYNSMTSIKVAFDAQRYRDSVKEAHE